METSHSGQELKCLVPPPSPSVPTHCGEGFCFFPVCVSIHFLQIAGALRISTCGLFMGYLAFSKPLCKSLNLFNTYNMLSYMDINFLITSIIKLITVHIQIPFLPLASCVILGKLLNFSAPPFSNLQMGDKNSPWAV